MSDRENFDKLALIDLLDDITKKYRFDAWENTDKIAECLIANGVTVGKPLTEYSHPIDNYEGLKGKYIVFKANTGERVLDCFVLRPAKDSAAVNALRAYADTTDNKTLAADIYNWVDKAPTVDAVPVKHGRWVWNEESECWVCSNCELSALNNYRGNSTDSNYCPNCGAKMDLEEMDDEK